MPSLITVGASWPPQAPAGIPAARQVPVTLTNKSTSAPATFAIWMRRVVAAPSPIPRPGQLFQVVAGRGNVQTIFWPFLAAPAVTLKPGESLSTVAESPYNVVDARWMRKPWLWTVPAAAGPMSVVPSGVFAVGGGVLVWNSDGTVSSATPLERRAVTS